MSINAQIALLRMEALRILRIRERLLGPGTATPEDRTEKLKALALALDDLGLARKIKQADVRARTCAAILAGRGDQGQIELLVDVARKTPGRDARDLTLSGVLGAIPASKISVDPYRLARSIGDRDLRAIALAKLAVELNDPKLARRISSVPLRVAALSECSIRLNLAALAREAMDLALIREDPDELIEHPIRAIGMLESGHQLRRRAFRIAARAEPVDLRILLFDYLGRCDLKSAASRHALRMVNSLPPLTRREWDGERRLGRRDAALAQFAVRHSSLTLARRLGDGWPELRDQTVGVVAAGLGDVDAVAEIESPEARITAFIEIARKALNPALSERALADARNQMNGGLIEGSAGDLLFNALVARIEILRKAPSGQLALPLSA